MKKKGEVRVGRCIYQKDGKRIDPSFGGFTSIVVLTKSSAYGPLGPYVLKDDKGRIVENVWQASKVYLNVPEISCPASRYDSRVIWSHRAENHAYWDDVTKTCKLNANYVTWRRKLESCPDPVRYPVGYDHRHTCLFSMAEKEDGTIDTTPLTYIEARKKIYVPVYTKAAMKTSMFVNLKARIDNGESLLIIEVDGPHEEDLTHYIQNYNVSNHFIVKNTMLATEENLHIMLNDPKHPYGHGYCLAAALLDLKVE